MKVALTNRVLREREQMRSKKIGVSALKDVAILYRGDIYELACLLLKLNDARDAGTNARTRQTVYGLAGDYAMLLHLSHEQVLAVLADYNLPLEATVEYDHDVAKRSRLRRTSSP